MQEERDQFLKDKEELKENLRGIKKDIRRLQAKSRVLDGLPTLAEAARRI